MPDVPDWCVEFLREWRNRLLLHEWSVTTSLTSAPNGDASGETKAQVRLWPDVREAEINISDDIPDEPSNDWRRTLIHELIHIRLAGVSEPLFGDIVPQLGASAADLADRWMRHEIEEVTDLLAFVLWRAYYNRENDERESTD